MISFDVFDMLITRMTATPDGIFALDPSELKYNLEYARIPFSQFGYVTLMDFEMDCEKLRRD